MFPATVGLAAPRLIPPLFLQLWTSQLPKLAKPGNMCLIHSQATELQRTILVPPTKLTSLGPAILATQVTVGLVPAADWFALVGVGPVGRQRGASLGFAVSGPLVGVRRGVVEGAPWVGWRGGFHGRAELEVHANVAASGCEFVKALVECPALPQHFGDGLPELFVCLEEFGGGDGSKATVAIWLRKAKVGNLVVVVLQVDQMGGLVLPRPCHSLQHINSFLSIPGFGAHIEALEFLLTSSRA